MEKINISRVLLSGLIAGIAYLIFEFFLEGLVNVVFDFTEAGLAQQYFPNITLSGTRYYIVNILYLFFTCSLTIWLYASLRPKFGNGAKTAFIASIFPDF